MAEPIYMDNHATTPVDPRVRDAMLPFLGADFGNAASRTHAWGWRAEAAVEQARERVAALIGCEPREVVFTSGATEANNLALKGAMEAYRHRGDHIVTVVTEHKAVLDPCERLEAQRARTVETLVRAEAERRGLEPGVAANSDAWGGDAEALLTAGRAAGLFNDASVLKTAHALGSGARVTYLPVESDGRVAPTRLAAAIEPGTVLVSVMAANNELGTLQPLEPLAAVCAERGALFHTDAAQAVGKVPFDVKALGVDLASVSAHKLYGPKGIGALYVRRRPRRVHLAPLIDGGGHERGLRSGTLDVASIVGFGKACELAMTERDEEATRLATLRDRLWDRLQLLGGKLNGAMEHRLPGNLNVSFEDIEADALLMELEDVALSAGSACTSASPSPSHVLQALGLTRARIDGSIRFGLGRFNTERDVDEVARRLEQALKQSRSAKP